MIHYLIATLILGLSTIPQTIWLLSKILPKRHSIHWITGLAAFKLVIYTFLTDYLLRNYYGDTSCWYMLWLLLGTTIPVAMYLVFIYVFDGQMIKRLMVPIIAETVIEIFAMLGLSLANMLAAGTFAADMMTDFGIYILLVPLFGYGLFALLWKITGKRIMKFRDHEFRHTAVLWIVVFLYLLAAVASYWQDVMASEERFLLLGLIPNILLASCLIALILRNRALSQQEMLHQMKMNAICKVLDSEYDEILLKQEERISQSRAYIEEHLKEIQAEGELSKAYLQELIEAYQDIDAGIYSEHKLLDALLSKEIRSCREENIMTDISVKALRVDRDKEKALMELFLYLFEEAREYLQKKEDARIQLSAAQVAGRIRITFSYKAAGYNGKDARKINRKNLRGLVKREDGEMGLKQEADGLDMEIFI